MGARRQGRIIAFQTLYSYEMSKADIGELMDFSWIGEARSKNIPEDSVIFARLLIKGTLENIDIIDRTIQKQLEHWDISRLARVDLSILRISV